MSQIAIYSDDLISEHSSVDLTREEQGLIVQALAHHAVVTRSPDDRARLRGLARYIRSAAFVAVHKY